MDENNTNNTPDTPQEPNPTTPEPVDTGLDVNELKEAIKALQEQTKRLTDELHRKAPDVDETKADFGAYFKDFMKR